MTIDSVVRAANKQFGDGTVVRGAALRSNTIDRVPSGSLSLDLALGGGWPLNQWHEIIGDESSGKTAVCLKTIAENQARNKKWTAMWVAAEALPWEWAERLGIDLNRLWLVDTNIMEAVYDITTQAIEGRDVDAVVIDSLPALIPERENDGTMEDFAVGLGALLTGKFFRKQYKAAKRSLTDKDRPVLALMINQWREKIGVTYGDPRTTPGGKGKNFAFFTRTDVRRTDWLDRDGPAPKVRIGQRIGARVFKNKSAPGQRTAEFDFYFDEGGPVPAGQYDTLTEIVNLGLSVGVIVRRGKYYDHRGTSICEGRAALIEAIRTDEVLQDSITTDVLSGKPVTALVAKRKIRRKSNGV